MADGVKIRPSSASDAVEFHADEVTYDGRTALAQRVKVVHGAPGSAVDASSTAPLPTTDAAVGTTADTAALNAAQTATLIAIAKGILAATQATKIDSDSITLNASSIDLSTDGLEALVAASNTALASVIAKLSADPATGAKQDAVTTSLGTDGSTAPALPGGATGIRGWLRGIYALLTGTLSTSVSNFPATQPVSLASNTPDVTDRSGRVLGHVTVDSVPTTAVTGPATDAQLRASALPVSMGSTLALTDAQLRASAVPTTPSTAGDVATALTDGRKTVAAAGTAEAIRASLACKWVTVTALKTNTAQVNVGGSGVLATLGGATGTPLDPGAGLTIPVDNASKVFVDARVSGEGVSFTVAS